MEGTTEKVWTLSKPKPNEEEGKAPSDARQAQLDKLFGFGVKMVSCAMLLHMRQMMRCGRSGPAIRACMPGMAVTAPAMLTS